MPARSPLLLASLRGYRRPWLTADLLAGMSVWAVLVPESLAYATIAGVPPVVGLYAAVPALVLYAVLGSSRHLVVATMSATAALSASVVAVYARPGSGDYVAITAMLAIVTGVLGVVAGLCRLGFLATFISEPVLRGFIVGLALTIIAGQLPALFGVPKEAGDFFEQMAGLLRQLAHSNAATLGVGLVSLAVVLGCRLWLPRLPGSLIAVLLGVAAVPLLDLVDRGVAIVGPIQAGLPTLGIPSGHGLADYLGLVSAAAGILLLGFVEGLGPAKAYAAREGLEIDANRELIGVGAANIGAGITAGMVVNGTLAKTAVNVNAGAKSQVSGLTAASLTIITLLFLTGLFENLPEATLAAIVIAAVIELVNIPALVRLYRVWTGHLGRIYGWAARADFIAALAALLGVLVFDTLPGLFIGIVVSILLLLYRASRPQVATLASTATTDGRDHIWVDAARHPDLPVRDDVLVVRVESGLFFANADNVRTAIRDRITPTTTAVVLDASTTPAIDVSATEMLAQLAGDLRRDGIALLIAHGIGQVRDVLRRAGAEQDVLQALYDTVDEAVAAAPPERVPGT
ncbi:SulP family inorganic anion transporter [Longivirga aurantiaca]|uniref:SulP family inorganic anion transporter n=1 Tax=Longivirga aurantiaca TaxID=1837743 RepID=A0ABW1T4J3_9ACTN